MCSGFILGPSTVCIIRNPLCMPSAKEWWGVQDGRELRNGLVGRTWGRCDMPVLISLARPSLDWNLVFSVSPCDLDCFWVVGDGCALKITWFSVRETTLREEQAMCAPNPASQSREFSHFLYSTTKWLGTFCDSVH